MTTMTKALPLRLLLLLLLPIALALASCNASPRPSGDLDQARRIYTELRPILTIGQSVAVNRGYLAPAEGDRALRVLQSVQDGLDAGAVGGAADGFLAVGDALLDALGREGRFRPEEIAAFKDMTRHLVALLTPQPPASQPAGD